MAGIADAKREARRYAGGMLPDSALIANPDNEWRSRGDGPPGPDPVFYWSDNARCAEHESLNQFSLMSQLHDTAICHLKAVCWNSDKRIPLSFSYA